MVKSPNIPCKLSKYQENFLSLNINVCACCQQLLTVVIFKSDDCIEKKKWRFLSYTLETSNFLVYFPKIKSTLSFGIIFSLPKDSWHIFLSVETLLSVGVIGQCEFVTTASAYFTYDNKCLGTRHHAGQQIIYYDHLYWKLYKKKLSATTFCIQKLLSVRIRIRTRATRSAPSLGHGDELTINEFPRDVLGCACYVQSSQGADDSDF